MGDRLEVVIHTGRPPNPHPFGADRQPLLGDPLYLAEQRIAQNATLAMAATGCMPTSSSI